MLTVPTGCRLHPNILKKLSFTSSSSVILALKAIFGTHGRFLSPAEDEDLTGEEYGNIEYDEYRIWEMWHSLRQCMSVIL